MKFFFDLKQLQTDLENDIRKVWGQNQITLGWFAIFVGFRAKSNEILTGTIFSHVNEK